MKWSTLRSLPPERVTSTRPRRCRWASRVGVEGLVHPRRGPGHRGLCLTSRPQHVDNRRRTTPLRWFTDDHTGNPRRRPTHGTVTGNTGRKGTYVRRGQIAVLIGIVSGLLSVLLAVAVNVATGGRLPGPLDRVAWLAWPAVALLAVIGGALAIWQQRLASPGSVPSTGSTVSTVSTVPAKTKNTA